MFWEVVRVQKCKLYVPKVQNSKSKNCMQFLLYIKSIYTNFNLVQVKDYSKMVKLVNLVNIDLIQGVKKVPDRFLNLM